MTDAVTVSVGALVITALVYALTLGWAIGATVGAFVAVRNLRTMVNLTTIGSATPHVAEIGYEADAEDRVSRLISEDTVVRGMQYLREQVYAPAGVTPSDAQLRDEARTMLAGNVPGVVAGLPRD